MYFMSFYMYRCERSCRAEVLTSSASDAVFFVHNRNLERLRVIRILSYHADSSCRTMSCAVSAVDVISIYDTVVKTYHSMSYLDR